MKRLLLIVCLFVFALCFSFNFAFGEKTFADSSKKYFTVYKDSDKKTVLFLKGDDVNVGDKYLSKDNKLYEISSVDEKEKIAIATFLKDEKLPKYNVKSKQNNVQAKAASKKKVGVYHTHNDESYFTPDGVDSVYGKGGIHDVGKAFVSNLNKLNIETIYREDMHLPHNSGAYTRSQVTASALLNQGAQAIFDLHRDSTKRSEYLTTVNGEKMSSVRMVVGSSSANFEANKNFAYSIKAYADEVYPNFIKDVYFGKGNYNQQLSTKAMLFEMGCENIEKDLAVKSTEVLAKVVDVVLFGSDGASELSLNDVSLEGDSGETAVINGLVSSKNETYTKGSNSTLWVVLGTVGTVLLTLTIVLVCSKRARYKVGRFFSEMFAGIFGKRKV